MQWLPLLDTVAYTLGYIDTPPVRGEAQNELLALVLMAQATAQLEGGNSAEAIPLLAEAVDIATPHSPMLAAQLMGTLADIRREVEGSNYAIVEQYQAALKLLEQSELSEDKAGLWLNLGIAFQEMSQGRRATLIEAVKAYQAALYTFKKETHPELFALAQTNLALAYLTMPMREASDQLRKGIAVQSLREALTVYRPDTHPEQWSSAQLNLANALQYLPSTHPVENLTQAVELYEEILSMRSPINDPLGFSRIEANQANALAHLGIFSHAKQKAQRALSVFKLYGEVDSAESLHALLDQIAEKEQQEQA
ncbi:MAG TPA: hypothetical protein ENJ56_00220 [Anaerolineae bacterium]|nr:hypothetical protein [Anaerolineae bacterium]